MSKLAALIRAGRESWLELDEPPRRAFKVRRLFETEMPRLLSGGFRVEDCVAAVVDWRGFTEVDLLGAGVGGEDKVKFEPEVADELIRDNGELVGKISTHLVEMMRAFFAARGIVEKN